VLTGHSLIGDSDVPATSFFRATDPSSNQPLEPAFGEAGLAEVDQACRLAAAAFDLYRETPLEPRAQFLRAIAEEIEALGAVLVERVMLESGLPRARVNGELLRTSGQLRLFADVVQSGDWLDLRVDKPLAERQPPRPELRQRRVPLGPVAVFGASNFPLAFSVAGGDTAAALAAGCPVVAKGHPAHPGTSELVGGAVRRAVQRCALPAGVFSLLQGSSHELGSALIGHPCIQAVGFTGSRRGGLALTALAGARPQPIPVYAEMSSINPVILLPAALAARGESLGQAYAASLTLGAGQFCTNPGIVIAVDGADLENFVAAASSALASTSAVSMLSPGIYAAYQAAVEALQNHSDITVVARGAVGTAANCGRAALLCTGAQAFLADDSLAEEVFGPASILVRCRDLGEVRAVLERLQGQLTATLHLDTNDMDAARSLLPTLERKAGRIVVNGWPTGVEVSSAMVHGGPFPATSDGRSTSVGSAAIERFLRPVCYQNLPVDLMPALLRPLQ
jgi:2,5-dioxopentanoate dehydrogenase